MWFCLSKDVRPVALPRCAASLVALLMMLGAMLIAPYHCRADFECPGLSQVRVRQQDQVFMVNLRPAGCTTSAERLANRLRVTQCVGTNRCGRGSWLTSSLDQITNWHDPSVVTIVYVHGNRVESNEAAPRGLFAYHRLVRCQGETPPLRFIILSWTSDQVKGPLRDYRLKAARTEPVAWEMAWLVNQIPGDLPIGFVGFSYGARVASGALHILGGGQLSRRMPTIAVTPRRPIRAAYIAAAFDSHWLGPNSRHGQAMNVTDTLMISVNRLDPAMRFYGLLYKGRNPRAMGYAGPTCLARDARARVKLYNVTDAVGRSHELCRYVSTPRLMSRIWQQMSFSDALDRQPSAPEPAPQPVVIGETETLQSVSLDQGPQVVDPSSAL